MGNFKVAVLLSGCGVYDGSELHEAVLSLYFLDKAGVDYQCTAPDIAQHHVINHLKGEPSEGETRNVLVESARIARGNIVSLETLDLNTVDGLLLPGGFGAAKNLSDWAFKGADGTVQENVKNTILKCLEMRKPIAGICVSPVVLAKATENTPFHLKLTIGSTEAPSPYDIAGFSSAIKGLGAQVENRAYGEIMCDDKHLVVTAPCYMMEVSIAQVAVGIENAVQKLIEYIKISKSVPA